jgi:hypothetical protein
MDEQNSEAEPRQPEDGLFLELGRQRDRNLALLKDGNGALSDEIRGAIRLRCNSVAAQAGAPVVPVVLLYRRRGGAKPGGVG